jgi:LPS sulfotransferase NodH
MRRGPLLSKAIPGRILGLLQPGIPREWAGNNRSYVPFLILSTQRTGSTLLSQLLRSHPMVVSFDEILHQGHIAFATPGFKHTRGRSVRARDAMPVRFLERRVYAGYRDDVAAVGCKVHYVHLERVDFAPIRRWLADRRDIRVIHLERRNQLRRYLSLMIARTTGTWHATDAGGTDSVRIRLDPDECLEFFSESEKLHRTYAELFAGHPVLDVQYEELATDRRHVEGRVLEFLDLPGRPLHADLVKSRTRPLAESIENYDLLRQSFAGTPYEAYLDEA